MRIIDSHCHLGASLLSPLAVYESDLLRVMGDHGISMALVMPHAVPKDPEHAHDDVAELCERHPDRFRGIVNLNPLLGEAEYRQRVTHYIHDRHFVALKLNPLQHLTSPLMANADKVFDVADDLGIPVIVHTGLGVPWALPSLCIPQARRHPQLPIVLAHAGYGVYTSEAYVAATECQNIFLEPSWCTVHDLHWLVREIGAGRVLFGSDLPDNVPVELAKYHAARLSEAELAACLGGTAERLFRLG